MIVRSTLSESVSCDALQAVRRELLRQQVALRDPELLLLGVARELDHVHAVEQRARDRVERVRGADEQHLREVERQVEVVVAEGAVLLRVEHLEHRARRVAAPVVAHLVDLVDQHQRVRRLGVAQRADDRAGHRADVRAPMAADLRLVAHAADREPDELASERVRDRVAERGLADAGRPDEAEDLAGDLVAQLRDGEVLDDPVLHLLEVEVVGVEHLARVLEVEVVLGVLAPRQRQDPLEVRADDAVLGGGGRQLLEPAELAVGGLAHLLRQLAERVELLAQLRPPPPAPGRPRRAPAGSPSAAGAGSTRAGPSPSRTAPATGSSSRARTPRARGSGSPRPCAAAARRRPPRGSPGAPRS